MSKRSSLQCLAAKPTPGYLSSPIAPKTLAMVTHQLQHHSSPPAPNFITMILPNTNHFRFLEGNDVNQLITGVENKEEKEDNKHNR